MPKEPPDKKERAGLAIAKDLAEESQKIRQTWSTNVEHPTAKTQLRLADLLDEAAATLTPGKPAGG